MRRFLAFLILLSTASAAHAGCNAPVAEPRIPPVA